MMKFETSPVSNLNQLRIAYQGLLLYRRSLGAAQRPEVRKASARLMRVRNQLLDEMMRLTIALNCRSGKSG